jgi:hypothetical protein
MLTHCAAFIHDGFSFAAITSGNSTDGVFSEVGGGERNRLSNAFLLRLFING